MIHFAFCPSRSHIAIVCAGVRVGMGRFHVCARVVLFENAMPVSLHKV